MGAINILESVTHRKDYEILTAPLNYNTYLLSLYMFFCNFNIFFLLQE